MTDARLIWLLDQAMEQPMTTAQVAVMSMLLALDARGRAQITKLELGALVGLKERQVATVLKDLEVTLTFIKKQRQGGTGKGRAANAYVIRPDATGNNVPVTWSNQQTSTGTEVPGSSNQQSSTGDAVPSAPRNQQPVARENVEATSNAVPSACGEILLPIEHGRARGEANLKLRDTSQLYPERAEVVATAAREPSLVDRVCDAVNSPYLDQHKSLGLGTTGAYIERWQRMGLTLDGHIIPTIRAKCVSLNGHGRPFKTFKYFDGMMIDLAATIKAAGEEPPHANERNRDADPGVRRRQRSPLTERAMRLIADGDDDAIGRVDSFAGK